ncbi:MAG TPA: biotin--[acetyl-CoA-carboxylase] ligase [Propionibacteriaceae bacterium]|nr:biotin--[acetyl-CoA-carboxylase] ligase [Propionibacteriaceae bacterium]
MPGLAAIDVDELRRNLLAPASLWQKISLVPETGSTNADLAEAARRGEPGGTVLITDYQSAGRGRLGRTWTAPPGTSIAMSVLLRPDGVDPQRWTWLPLLTGLAVTEAVRRAAGLDAVLKWPNDVLLGERKLCGILAERVETAGGPACVIGMGINVSLTEAELPIPTATSLALAAEQAGRPAPGRTEVILEVLRELGVIVPRWLASPNDAAVAQAYRARCATLGRRVQVLVSPSRTVSGLVTDIDTDGRLVVQTESGREVFGAGDVIHLR